MTSQIAPSFLQAKEALQEEIKRCKSDPSYNNAVRLCAADRELWVSFYDSWLDEPALSPEAGPLARLFQDACKTLSLVSAQEPQKAHIGAMIANTAARGRMFNAIATSEGVHSALKQIRSEYAVLKSSRGIG